MTKTVANQRSYSDATSGVWFAPLGTPLPTLPLPGAWPSGWMELGLLTDKGIIESFSRTATQSWNWQGGSQGRTLYTQPVGSFQIEANEENSHVLRLARPGSTVSAAAGTNEVQTVTITGTPTGGTFTLTYLGQTTAPIAYNAAASAVQTALQALTNVGTGNATVAGGPGPGTPYVVTFVSALGNQDITTMTASGASLTGGSTPAAAVATTTPGVAGINTTYIKAYTGTDYFQFGIDLVDGNYHKRYVVPQGDAVRTGTVNYVASALTVNAFTINCYPDSNGNLAIDINDNPALSGTI